MTHEKQKKILSFWFGEDPLHPLENQSKWFTKSAAFDSLVSETFGGYLEDAASGAYDDWMKTKDGCLAFVILCDQFPRNAYRDDAKSFSLDAKALRAAQIAISNGWDLALSPVERAFLYLPFEHSEAQAIQTRSIELFTALSESAQTSEVRGFIAQALQYATAHRDIIESYGRFPHRNSLVGRETTKNEQDFLKGPGSSF